MANNKALTERQRIAVDLLTGALGRLARRDERLRPCYGSIASAPDLLSALEAGAEAVAILADGPRPMLPNS